jgi:hypothetical protein
MALTPTLESGIVKWVCQVSVVAKNKFVPAECRRAS